MAVPASFAAGAPPIAAEAQGGSVDAAAPAALGSDGQVKHAEAQAAPGAPAAAEAAVAPPVPRLAPVERAHAPAAAAAVVSPGGAQQRRDGW